MIIAIASSKGGTSKSTTAWALASYLSKDLSVLLWDADPVATLTSSAVCDFDLTAYDILINKEPFEKVVRPALPAYSKNLRIVPAGNLLTGLESASAGDIERQHILSDILGTVNDADVIIIDCPAGQGILTTSALVAAETVLTPAPCQPASFAALYDFERTVGVIRRRLNPELRWFILPTMYSGNQRIDQDVLEAMRKRYGDLVLDPPIRKRVALQESMAAQVPCQSEDYEQATNNLIGRITNEEEICSQRNKK